MPSQFEMERVIVGKTTVSDKIRALNAAGFARADIARFLDKRYQHVRNVLEDDRPRNARSATLRQERDSSSEDALSGHGASDARHALSGLEAGGTAFQPEARTRRSLQTHRVGNLFRLKVDADGAVHLPQTVLDAFGLQAGRTVVADLNGETFTLMSPKESLQRARAMVPQWRPGDPMWSDELIAERRREATAEDRNG